VAAEPEITDPTLRHAFTADGLGLPAFPAQLIDPGEGLAGSSDGLGAHIMGATVVGWLSGRPLRRWGVAWLSGGTLALRFRRHLEVGDPLVLLIGDAPGDERYQLRSPDGALCADGWSTMDASSDEPVVPSWVPPPEPKLDPRVDLVIGTELGSVELDFDAERDLAFVERLDAGDPWRTMSVAHPAWLTSAVNALIRRSVEFEDGRFVHAGVVVRTRAPIKTGSQLVVHAKVVERFDTPNRHFAVINAMVTSSGTPMVTIDHTIAF